MESPLALSFKLVNEGLKLKPFIAAAVQTALLSIAHYCARKGMNKPAYSTVAGWAET